MGTFSTWHVHYCVMICHVGGLGLSCRYRNYAVEIGTEDCVSQSGTGTGELVCD